MVNLSNKIMVEIKSSYGTKWIKVSSEHKDAINALTGKQTLNQEHINALKALGYTFEVKQAAPPLELAAERKRLPESVSLSNTILISDFQQSNKGSSI